MPHLARFHARRHLLQPFFDVAMESRHAGERALFGRGVGEVEDALLVDQHALVGALGIEWSILHPDPVDEIVSDAGWISVANEKGDDLATLLAHPIFEFVY